MQYALIGDIHSSKSDLERVLAHIQKVAPAAKIVGTGDLFECTISKRKAIQNAFHCLDDVIVNPEGFEQLVMFPSVRGNQEERILFITQSNEALRSKLEKLPETIDIDHAQIIHGHQWTWGGNPWSLQDIERHKGITFYGHSHEAGLTINGMNYPITLHQSYSVRGQDALVNVGAVVYDREWVLYDAETQTVRFEKAK